MHSPIGNKFSKSTIISLSGLAVLLIATVLTVTISQQQQETRSQASTISATTLLQGTKRVKLYSTRFSNKCVDIAYGSTSPGARVQLYDCFNTEYQKFDVVPVAIDKVHIRYKGMCFDVAGAATGNGARIILYGCRSLSDSLSGAQTWTPIGSGVFKNTRSGRCLDGESGSNGTQLKIWDCNGLDYQTFLIEDLNPAPTPTPTKTPTPTSVPPTATPTPAAPTATPTPSAPFLTVNKTTAAAGDQITATWGNVPTPTANDFIGLHTQASANGTYIGWIYVSCTQTPTVAKASGSCTFPLPDSIVTGTYDLRFHTNNTANVLIKSQAIAITGVNAPTATPTVPPTPTPTTSTTAPTATNTPTPVPPTQMPATLTPTTPPAPGSTIAKVNLLLHGIGKGGDSANPDALGNANPLRKTRTVTVDVYNAQNQLAVTKQATVTFDTTSGTFKGDINLGSDFATGVYTMRIKTTQYLRGLVSGIQTITKGQTATLPNLTLIAGDVNNDNQINIIDYNLLTGCYSDLLPAIDCTEANKLLTDFNDDGKTNQFDYNLFLRELTNIGGQ